VGDFVIALYTPRSRERRDQLERAMAIVSRYRPPATPVVVAINLGRNGEQVTIVSLREFDCDRVDMLTLILIGSSQSRAIVRGDGRTVVYTPRGYATKQEPSR
jgi:cobalt-precorrin 5A hydrolase/precorrin-3B C17-methyltransferase